MSYGNIYSLIVSNFETDATKTAAITEKLLQAAGTIAAGTGYTVESVLENLRSGINGSSEAVDQLGLNLKTANLAAAAGVESWDKLTTEQQQAIIVQEILNQTANKYGKIADTAAARQAAFTAQLANTKMALGNLGATIWSAIMPALTKLLAFLEVVFNYATKAVASIMAMFGMKISFGGGSATNEIPESGGGTKTPATNTSGTDKAKDANKKAKDSSDNAKKSNDKLSNSYDKVGESAKNSADKVKESSDTMKGALAGLRLAS